VKDMKEHANISVAIVALASLSLGGVSSITDTSVVIKKPSKEFWDSLTLGGVSDKGGATSTGGSVTGSSNAQTLSGGIGFGNPAGESFKISFSTSISSDTGIASFSDLENLNNGTKITGTYQFIKWPGIKSADENQIESIAKQYKEIRCKDKSYYFSTLNALRRGVFDSIIKSHQDSSKWTEDSTDEFNSNCNAVRTSQSFKDDTSGDLMVLQNRLKMIAKRNDKIDVFNISGSINYAKHYYLDSTAKTMVDTSSLPVGLGFSSTANIGRNSGANYSGFQFLETVTYKPKKNS